MTGYDAVIVGAGPNGLAAAVHLARNGLSVHVIEARDLPGGGATTEELIQPGVFHDVCSSVHPLGIGSPFFRSLPLDEFGLEWVQPQTPLAHPLEGDDAAALEVDIETTARGLGDDAGAWLDLFTPFVERADELMPNILAPLRWPPDPLLMARFGLPALRSAGGLARSRFRRDHARALFAGCCAHSLAPLGSSPTAAYGLTLIAAGHAYGWPFARGGSRAIIRALVDYLEELDGTIECSNPVRSLNDLPPARVVLMDLTPRLVLDVAGPHLSSRYRRSLQRYRHGPGVCKIDWILSEPIPWRSPACRRAGTIHVGGTLDEIERAEAVSWEGVHPERPFIVAAQPSIVDDTRAPDGVHTAWAYCHVPHDSKKDMAEAIEREIELVAPGFRDVIVARRTLTAHRLGETQPNFVGGDIAGGAMTLSQLFMRPTVSPKPYRTSIPGVYICSCATPPGGGVHGMSGFHAAETALGDLRRGIKR